MVDLIHRVKVFVFRHSSEQPSYLLLRSAQGLEGVWGPLHGPLPFGEQLESAIRREVMDGVGISRPLGILDLQMPSRWDLGDEQVIEWTYGFHVEEEVDAKRVVSRWAEYRWAEFHEAYPRLELEPDRGALMRLHGILRGE
jgi:ADP-ribose pyrophosphatase YjhB (NUDIX family)